MKHSLFKKFGATFVALTLAFSSASAVSAAGDTSEFQPKVTYSNGNYTFAKLSHPDKAVSTPDGIVDYLGGGNVGVTGQDQGATGQGDQGQSYAWSAASYGDWMYVGTCYAAMGNTLTLMDTTLGDKFDKDVMTAALKAMFNGTFFYGHEKEDGTADEDSDGILVKVNVKTGETKLLMSQSLMVKDHFSETLCVIRINFISVVLYVIKVQNLVYLAFIVSILRQMISSVSTLV